MQKIAFLALKWCFLALGVHLQPPLPYFEGAGLSDGRILSIRCLVSSVSGPPAPKNSHFCSKNAENVFFFALKWCFLAPGVDLQSPLPYFGCARLKSAFVSSLFSLVTSVSGPPAPKNSHFCNKKKPEMAFFDLKWRCLPHTCGSSIRSLVPNFFGLPAPKTCHFCSKKMPKITVFCPEVVFSGPGPSPAAPPTLF